MRAEDRDYHFRRARQELDEAYRASGRMAAAAHMRLAALHMASAGLGVAGADPEDALARQQAFHAPIASAR